MIHHPYRCLTELQLALGFTQDELTLAWSVINDHYVTDLPLIHAPHIIAVTAVVMTIVIRPSQGNAHGAQLGGPAMRMGQPASTAAMANTATAQSKAQRLTDWLVHSGVDVDAVAQCTQEMISVYVLWESYNDKECKESISRFVHEVSGRDSSTATSERIQALTRRPA